MQSLPYSSLAYEVQGLSIKQWGTKKSVSTIGCDTALLKAQKKLGLFARMNRPVLITGESGVGKELFAKSLYLLGERRGKPFLTVNCAHYQDDNLIISELFGHKKGSFTGAANERRGLFEEADTGVLFMDEVGELSPKAQAMLLRALSEQEIKALGSNETRQVDVRIVAATNQPLKLMVEQGDFREDLFYRLRQLWLHIPAVRERGEDWKLLAQFFLGQLADAYGVVKRFSDASMRLLEQYPWPGNVREIQSVVYVAYCMSERSLIEPDDFADELDFDDPSRPFPKRNGWDGEPRRRYELMLHEGECFWEVVRRPYMQRDLNRTQVRAIVAYGLQDAQGSYKKLLSIFRIDPEDYLKFMDFLRHHRLKPEKLAER